MVLDSEGVGSRGHRDTEGAGRKDRPRRLVIGNYWQDQALRTHERQTWGLALLEYPEARIDCVGPAPQA